MPHDLTEAFAVLGLPERPDVAAIRRRLAQWRAECEADRGTGRAYWIAAMYLDLGATQMRRAIDLSNDRDGNHPVAAARRREARRLMAEGLTDAEVAARIGVGLTSARRYRTETRGEGQDVQ